MQIQIIPSNTSPLLHSFLYFSSRLAIYVCPFYSSFVWLVVHLISDLVYKEPHWTFFRRCAHSKSRFWQFFPEIVSNTIKMATRQFPRNTLCCRIFSRRPSILWLHYGSRLWFPFSFFFFYLLSPIFLLVQNAWFPYFLCFFFFF